MPKSPDPQLGLARLYVYGLKDIDKADAALQQAERHGHRLGNREKAQLADGYRQRADRLWYDSRNVRGLPQEKDQVQKVADDYQRALQLYQEIAPYGNASAMIARVESRSKACSSGCSSCRGERELWMAVTRSSAPQSVPRDSPGPLCARDAWPAAYFPLAAGGGALIGAGFYLVFAGQVAALRPGGKGSRRQADPEPERTLVARRSAAAARPCSRSRRAAVRRAQDLLPRRRPLERGRARADPRARIGDPPHARLTGSTGGAGRAIHPLLTTEAVPRC